MDFVNIPMLPILAKKPKKRTKKCVCGVHAPSNKSTFCKSCPGKVPKWVKPVKNKNAGNGKVCPVEGCGWSTKANRKHFCGGCGAPFGAYGKRKTYNKSGLPAKKKQKKTKQDFLLSSFVSPPTLLREFSLEPIVFKKEPECENWTNFVFEEEPEPECENSVFKEEPECENWTNLMSVSKNELECENWTNLMSTDDLIVDITSDLFDHISTDIVEEVSSKYSEICV